MKLRLVPLLSACLALTLSSSVLSAEDVNFTEFDEITVTATRSERSLLDVPAAVSVVTEERLDDLPMLGPKEALSGLAGVQSETRNGGYDARLIIRGSGLKARYGVREIMVLLDGVPITDPDGMTRLDFVDTQLIKQIDVVRGPNSTLYGANAVGGVINFITRDPFEEYKSVAAGFGSNNTQMYSLVYGTGLGNTYISVSGTHKQTDGWREWNDFRSTQGSMKAGQLLADGSVLTGMFSYTNAELQLPGTLTEQEYDEDPSQLTSEPFRNNGRDSKVYSTSLSWGKELGDWRFKPLIYLNNWHHDHPVPGTINDGGATIFGTDLQANYSHKLFGKNAALTTGVSGQCDDGDNKKYTYSDVVLTPTGAIAYTLSDAKGDLAERSDDRVYKWGVYLEESLQLHPRWTVDMGIRYDYIAFDLDSTVYREFIWGANRYVFLPRPEEINTDRNYDHFSPRIGLTWEVTDQSSFYGNISTGFQTPQASELNENSSLDPSETINYEVGFKVRSQQGHRLDLALFYQRVDDEIALTLLEDNQTSYSNAGTTNKYGVELAGEIALPYGFTTGGTYTYSDFSYDNFIEPVYEFVPGVGTVLVEYDRGGNQLPYIPRHQYDWFLSYRHSSGVKARFDTVSWGEYWVDNANSEKYKGYDLVSNLMLGWEKGPWDLVLNVSNLFDKDYAMEVTKGGSDLQFRPGAPRSVFAKLSYRF